MKPLWYVVDLVFDTRVNFEQILGLDELFVHGSVTTLICFLIYKEWLLLSLDKLTCRPKKCSADKFDSSDPSYCQFLIKL